LTSLKLNTYKVFFALTILVWLVNYLICTRNNIGIATALFAISLYWFTGIFSPDSLSILGVTSMAVYIKSSIRPKLGVLLVLLLFTASIKITSIGLILPILIFYSWHHRTQLFAILGISFFVFCATYFLSDTAQSHIPWSILKTQYLAQLAIILISAFITLVTFKITTHRNNLFLLFLMALTTALIFSISNRQLGAWILGSVLALFAISNSFSVHQFWSRKNCFLMLAVLLSYIGSNTGLYKSVYLLPLLAFVDVPKANRSRVIKSLLAMAVPLLLLKPFYFNFGSSDESAKIVKSIFERTNLHELTIWNVPGHGDFVVCKWLPNCFENIDQEVEERGIYEITFMGPCSTFLNARYSKNNHHSFLGPQSAEVTTPAIIGRCESTNHFSLKKEYCPGFSLYEKK